MIFRDRTCIATALRTNEGRKVTGTNEIANKKKSSRPDLLLLKNDIEFGCSELGKSEDVVSTRKEIIENELHCPKTLKNILNRVAGLVDYNEEIIRKLRFVCFHQTSLGYKLIFCGVIIDRRMKLSFIDCPRGYICRIMETNEYEVPSQAKFFSAQILPLTKLDVVAETMQVLMKYQMNKKDDGGLKCQNQNKPDTIVLPTSLNFTSNPKKRKRSDQE
ncbi:hypothetical protein INT45_008460 [Circinella minor]|uniref:Uncharacterized protein n=1 Tax=Circinella minor TaxID=1195481 RepID=A0A8H7SDP2_9FUNG|nr:hypothetical protein INT45_008460 [Circinella minor]